MKIVTGSSGLLGSEILDFSSGSIEISSKKCNLIRSCHSILTLEKARQIKILIMGMLNKC